MVIPDLRRSRHARVGPRRSAGLRRIPRRSGDPRRGPARAGALPPAEADDRRRPTTGPLRPHRLGQRPRAAARRRKPRGAHGDPDPLAAGPGGVRGDRAELRRRLLRRPARSALAGARRPRFADRTHAARRLSRGGCSIAGRRAWAVVRLLPLHAPTAGSERSRRDRADRRGPAPPGGGGDPNRQPPERGRSRSRARHQPDDAQALPDAPRGPLPRRASAAVVRECRQAAYADGEGLSQRRWPPRPPPRARRRGPRQSACRLRARSPRPSW